MGTNNFNLFTWFVQACNLVENFFEAELYHEKVDRHPHQLVGLQQTVIISTKKIKFQATTLWQFYKSILRRNF